MRLNLTGLTPHIQETKPFVDFYKRVMAAIYQKLDSHKPAHQYAPFMEFLCAGFWKEYLDWQRGPIFDFLQQVYHNAVRALQVVCQAYLHMVYDLPRVIANGLLAGHAQPNRFNAESFFYDFDDSFDEPLAEQFKDFKSVGIFALIRLPKKFALHQIAVVWVHSLRARAFHNGTVLEQTEIQLGAARRRLLESDLRIYVTNTAVKVLSNRLNPVSWLRLLKAPSITMPLIAPLALFVMPVAVRSTTTAISLIILVIILLYVALAYIGLLRMVARLGSEISLVAQTLMERAETFLPQGLPRQDVSKQT